MSRATVTLKVPDGVEVELTLNCTLGELSGMLDQIKRCGYTDALTTAMLHAITTARAEYASPKVGR